MNSSFKIVAHRGTPGGMIPENTSAAALIAFKSGADNIEIDVTCSTDGVAYAFHDGAELENLGIHENLSTLSSAEIDELRYVWGQIQGERVPVERLEHLLDFLRGTGAEIHIDRAWSWWEPTLAVLDEARMDDQLFIKVPATTAELGRLERLKPRARTIPIVKSVDVMSRIFGSSLRVPVIELVGMNPADHQLSSETIDMLHDDGYRIMANAEVVGAPLFGGYDDEVSIFEDPEAGWGKLLERGVDLIQTDFPWLLAAWRDKRKADASA